MTPGKKTPPTEAERAALLSKRGQQLTAALGEVVAILMRDPRFRHMTLSEVEAAVLPAIVTNQFMLMRGTVRTKSEGADEPKAGELGEMTVPLGLAIWASVSDAVDGKLQRQSMDGAAYRLSPNEWKSGENMWLLALVGPPQSFPALRKQLDADVFKGREVKVGALAKATSTGTERNG